MNAWWIFFIFENLGCYSLHNACLIKGHDNMILKHHRYELDYWRICNLPSDRVVIKEDLVFLEEQQGTTTPKAMIQSHDLNHGAQQGLLSDALWNHECWMRTSSWFRLFMGYLPTCIIVRSIIIHLYHYFHWHIHYHYKPIFFAPNFSYAGTQTTFDLLFLCSLLLKVQFNHNLKLQ
jgi:hypothetical protein